ncbi:MAG: hypothetical protein J5764_06140 [Bacteroidales bacterium]|nr:hypothetical protein [Bacteroidales bacterium]
MTKKFFYSAPSIELVMVLEEALLNTSPGDRSDNGTEVGSVTGSGWDEWDYV